MWAGVSSVLHTSHAEFSTMPFLCKFDLHCIRPWDRSPAKNLTRGGALLFHWWTHYQGSLQVVIIHLPHRNFLPCAVAIELRESFG
jgi:hypothetical protein